MVSSNIFFFWRLFSLYLAARSGFKTPKHPPPCHSSTLPSSTLSIDDVIEVALRTAVSRSRGWGRTVFILTSSNGSSTMASAAEKAPYSDYILSLSLNDLSSEIDRALQMHSLSFPRSTNKFCKNFCWPLFSSSQKNMILYLISPVKLDAEYLPLSVVTLVGNTAIGNSLFRKKARFWPRFFSNLCFFHVGQIWFCSLSLWRKIG